MLYHTCKEHGEIYIDMARKMHLLAKYVAIRPDGIKPSSLIIKESDKYPEPEYFCISCEKQVSIDTIVCKCQMCGHDFNVNEIFKIAEVGGIYCKTCSDTYFQNNRKYVLAKILAKFVG